MINESDIFGGIQWSPKQQIREEITSLCAQLYNTIESRKKLSHKEKKTLKKYVEEFELEVMKYNK